jgi:hypothetical protein
LFIMHMSIISTFAWCFFIVEMVCSGGFASIPCCFDI